MMKWMKPLLVMFVLGAFVAGNYTAAFASKNKFKHEMDKEKVAVKLVREVQRGNYDVVTTEGLKGWIDGGKDMLIIDTMPYEASYKKMHVPGAKQFLFPIPDMNAWDSKEIAGKSQADFVALLGPDKDKACLSG